jgi:hypothetical protein
MGRRFVKRRAATTTTFLASVNALLLAGAYWALREAIDFMNGDVPL